MQIQLIKNAPTADELQAAMYQDRFPISYNDCSEIVKVMNQAIEAGGGYLMAELNGDKGHVVTAYLPDESVLANIVINRPSADKERKVPSLKQITAQFVDIGYDKRHPVIKAVTAQIECHIRDGGSWSVVASTSSIHYTLKYRGAIKSSLSFYAVDLTV